MPKSRREWLGVLVILALGALFYLLDGPIFEAVSKDKARTEARVQQLCWEMAHFDHMRCTAQDLRWLDVEDEERRRLSAGRAP